MTREIYRVRLGEICFDRKMIRRIVDIGLPAAIQQSITSFSNVIVQSYIELFRYGSHGRVLCYAAGRRFFAAAPSEL